MTNSKRNRFQNLKIFFENEFWRFRVAKIHSGRIPFPVADYGIKFNSNFQWSTTSRDVKDGNAGHITREPEQVKAFRDTWRDGIHSYLTYLRDRLTVARDLLTDSGSIFVQIGDENVHRVRALMDEVFGENNCVSLIGFAKTSAFTSNTLSSTYDYILWFAKNRETVKYRSLWKPREERTVGGTYNSIEFKDGAIRRLTALEVRGEAKIPDGKRFVAPHYRICRASKISGYGPRHD